MISYIKNLKLKLQFTGWLQYIPTMILALLFLFVASILWLFNSLLPAYIFLALASFLLIVEVFDLLTVKFNIRPREPLPKCKDEMDTFDLIRSRRSCRSFQNRNLTSSDHRELLAAVERINSPENSTIGKNSIRFEYVDAPLTVWPTVGAQEFLVAIVPKTYSRQSVIDVGRNLQKIVLYATKMGLATCWIGPGADQSSIVKHLGDRFYDSEDHIICVCAIGYKSIFKPFFLRIIQTIQRNRLPISALFFTDPKLSISLDEKVDPFNRFGRCYEVCQWSPSSFNGQTTRCVAVGESTNEGNKKDGDLLITNSGFHLKRFDFYATTNSRYYAPVALGIWCANWETGCESLGIKGHFEILSEKDRYPALDSPLPDLPVYDVSWILEEVN